MMRNYTLDAQQIKDTKCLGLALHSCRNTNLRWKYRNMNLRESFDWTPLHRRVKSGPQPVLGLFQDVRETVQGSFYRCWSLIWDQRTEQQPPHQKTDRRYFRYVVLKMIVFIIRVYFFKQCLVLRDTDDGGSPFCVISYSHAMQKYMPNLQFEFFCANHSYIKHIW